VGESSHQQFAKKTYETGSGKRELELKYGILRNIRVSLLKIGVRCGSCQGAGWGVMVRLNAECVSVWCLQSVCVWGGGGAVHGEGRLEGRHWCNTVEH
jgi:hypothetical protein